MAKASSKVWKRGRGKLGIFEPLLGTWRAEAESPMGPVSCIRRFSRVMNDSFVLLEAEWQFSGKTYFEHALYGVDDSGTIAFWSFTSDGKRSQGQMSTASDLHPEAIAFEADMPAGRARTAYWPGESDGQFNWVVESKTKKGWNRFTHHQYSR